MSSDATRLLNAYKANTAFLLKSSFPASVFLFFLFLETAHKHVLYTRSTFIILEDFVSLNFRTMLS